MGSATLSLLTCVLLGGHLSAHDSFEMLQPVFLVTLRLTGEQEAAVWGLYGDALLPGAIAVGPSWQPSRGAVALTRVAQKHLPLGKGVLQSQEYTGTHGKCVNFPHTYFDRNSPNHLHIIYTR